MDSNLHDVGYEGFTYTWCHSRTYRNTIRARLDRACATQDFVDLFPDSKLKHVHSIFSDHLPLVFSFENFFKSSKTTNEAKRHRRFMFEAMWIKADDCENVIQQSWKSASADNACVNLLKKTDECRMGLLQWSKSKFGNVCSAADDLRKKIAKLQQGTLSDAVKSHIGTLTNQLEAILDREDTM